LGGAELHFWKKSDHLFNGQPYQWCNGVCARLECGGSWVEVLVGSNQRL